MFQNNKNSKQKNFAKTTMHDPHKKLCRPTESHKGELASIVTDNGERWHCELGEEGG